MDQPTYLELNITGTKQNVMPAANAAARIINLDSPKENFENRVKKMLENNFKHTIDSDTAEFSGRLVKCLALSICEDANIVVEAGNSNTTKLIGKRCYELCQDICRVGNSATKEA